MTLDVSKVSARHLERDAYLYVRQSTVPQVFENAESTERQYALRQRAVTLGWPEERVVVIDCDLGQSGASCARREGFKRLVAEGVGTGRAGMVLGTRGFTAGPQLDRLASSARDLRHDRHPDLGRGWRPWEEGGLTHEPV